jgi:RHS repeat-associated protein
MAWRGHYIDPTGLYYLGTRYYAPDSGSFLSADSLGHRATPDLYQAFNGNPISYFDPDGRLATGALTGQDYNAASTAGAYAGLLNPLTALTQAASSLILQDTLLNQTTLAPLNKAITTGLTSYFGASSGSGNTLVPIYIPPAPTSWNQAASFTSLQKDPMIPSGAVTLHSGSGQAFYAPPTANLPAVLNAGQANGPYNISGIKRDIGQYGPYDYQRNQGQGNLAPARNVFQLAFTDLANFSVGTYMRGAGFTLFGTDIAGWIYAKRNSSNFGTKSQPQWWANGWNDANATILNRAQ